MHRPFFAGCRLRKDVKTLSFPSLKLGRLHTPPRIGFPSYSSKSAIGMAQPQHHKLKLSVKPKERSPAEEPQRLAEGLPYASIVKGYYRSVPCLYRFCELCELCSLPHGDAHVIAEIMLTSGSMQGISILIQYIPAQLSESIIHVVSASAPECQRRGSPGRRNSGLVATEPARRLVCFAFTVCAGLI